MMGLLSERKFIRAPIENIIDQEKSVAGMKLLSIWYSAGTVDTSNF